MLVVKSKKMAINILSLNATILARLTNEIETNNDKILLIDRVLNQQTLLPETINELQTLRLKYVQEKIHDKIEFYTKTHELIDEYSSIVSNPLSENGDNEKVLARKSVLTFQLLDLYRQIQKSKGWGDIEIPVVTNDKIYNECKTCGNDNEETFEIDDNNNKICMFCATQKRYLEIGVTYKDYGRVNIINRFVYNRVLHFNDCIKQYQGKQNCKIPEEVFLDLDEKFIMNRIIVIQDHNNPQPPARPDPVRYSKITRAHILMFLKDLKYSKHYENANLIYYLLTNKRVDDITHLETQLLMDFKTLIELYDEIYGKDKEKIHRKNFLNSSYLLYQLLRRHNHQCKLEHFTILKTIDRKKFHDDICQNLFYRLQWKFTPIF